MQYYDNLPLSIFIDESGDFNFSKKGTAFYTLSALTTFCPHEKDDQINSLRDQIIYELGKTDGQSEYLNKLKLKFHAAEDKQSVRDEFFTLIRSMSHCRVYSIVIRKNRMNPSLYEPHRFYPQFLGYLLDYIFKRHRYSSLSIYVSGMPVMRRKNTFKRSLSAHVARKGITCPYSINYPTAESSNLLQVVDYVNWAIYRKWERNDVRSYNLVNGILGKRELDIFLNGDTEYY